MIIGIRTGKYSWDRVDLPRGVEPTIKNALEHGVKCLGSYFLCCRCLKYIDAEALHGTDLQERKHCRACVADKWNHPIRIGIIR